MSQFGETAKSTRIAGSFRDPDGYVFCREGRVYRAITEGCHRLLMELADNGVLGELLQSRKVVGTSVVAEGEVLAALRREHAPYRYFLEHDRIAPLTFPYEWSLGMLADAAMCTLDLQVQLLEHGCSLKDATAYNIQFVHGRPLFIDVPSIERPRRVDLWYAYGQFSRMFTFPLLLARHYGWDLRSYFLGQLDGRTCEQVVRTFGPVGRFRPRLVVDITLPWLLGRREERNASFSRADLQRRSGDSRAQKLNLQRLRNKIRKLTRPRRRTGWSTYTTMCSYDDCSERHKKDLVRRFLEDVRPRRVLDLGCNTGDYSFIAAAGGAQVIAMDSDSDAIDVLYERLQREPAAITPMVADLCHPSPAIGLHNAERPALLQRLDADCVLALAVLHHLVVSGNLTLQIVRDMLYELNADHVVLEFVPTSDPMFQRLTRFRTADFEHVTLDGCRAVFAERFTVVECRRIRGSPRSLLFLRRRRPATPRRRAVQTAAHQPVLTGTR